MRAANRPNGGIVAFASGLDSRLATVVAWVDARSLWQSWAVLLGLAVLPHLLTLELSPIIWFDEVQIIDWGRTLIFDPGSDWSLSWLEREGRPATNYGFIGPALQELAYRANPGSPIGPRLSAVLGAMLAASALVVWLHDRGLPATASLCGGWLLFLHPNIVQSYRGGRVDGWALAGVIMGAVLLRRGIARNKPGLSLFGGSMVGVAPLLWPGAVIAMALPLVELYEGRVEQGARSVTKHAAAFAAGGFCVAVPAVAFYCIHIGDPIAHASAAVGTQLALGTTDRIDGIVVTLVENLESQSGAMAGVPPRIALPGALAAAVRCGHHSDYGPWVAGLCA